MRPWPALLSAVACVIGHTIAFQPQHRITTRSVPPPAGLLDNFWDGITGNNAASPTSTSSASGEGGPTNEVVGVVDGIRQKRLGGSDIIVSEVGLGTQRWGSADTNAPNKEECFRMMDCAIQNSGVNLIDTAEQYPIPSDFQRPEGSTESIIGEWMARGGAARRVWPRRRCYRLSSVARPSTRSCSSQASRSFEISGRAPTSRRCSGGGGGPRPVGL